MKRTISIQEKNKLFDLLVSMYNNLNIKNIHMFQTALKKLGFNIQHVDCILELIDKRLLTRDKFNILLTYRMRDDMFYEFLNASDEKIDDYVEQLKEIEDWEKMISKIINDLAQHEHMDLKIGPNDINDEKITILAEAITYDTIEIDDII